MFRLEQAALLAIQLLIMWHVLAVSRTDDRRDVVVSRRNKISFTCNTTMKNISQIIWKKDRLFFSHRILKNKTVSNFTSPSVSIDPNFPLKLNIINAQHEDAGLYKCEVTVIRGGVQTIVWNLTVLEIANENSSSIPYHFLYVLPPAIGLLLCGFSAAVCLCRKLWTGTPNQDQVLDEFQSGEEVVLHKLQSGVVSTCQYIKRLSSIDALSAEFPQGASNEQMDSIGKWTGIRQDTSVRTVLYRCSSKQPI
ncbi:hypothetical protein PAMA_003161 [Pampus argenteus]